MTYKYLYRSISYLLFFSLLFVGCAEKFSLDELAGARSAVVSSDTAYVEIVPPFEGFNEPNAVLIGNDYMLYVADTKNNRVVLMDISGAVLSSRNILQPISIAQDQRLDLLIGGLVVEPNGDTVCAVFRLKLVSSEHSLEKAKLDTVYKEFRLFRRFVGIGILPNNQYLVARTGPDNTRFNDPDTRIMYFDANDRYITPLSGLATRAGSGITDINQVTALSTLPNSRDFIVLQKNEGIVYGAIWLIYQLTPDFDGWLPKYDPAKPEQRFVDFIQPNRFVNPSGVVIDGRRGDIFIADASQDSIFKFDSRGRLKSESFGYWKTFGRMKRPSGVAFFNRTLYVADSKENKIFRFRLSTDFY